MDHTDQKITNWHPDILPRPTKKALDTLSQADWLTKSTWYLAGGTALALFAGHRQSLDLDFFTPEKDFPVEKLLRNLENLEWITDIAEPGTVYGRLHTAKISFIAYPFFIYKEEPLQYGTIRILSPHDIAVMKTIAISQRGKKRDFIDLYWYVHHGEPLIDILRCLPKQYPTIAHDYHHILKSLRYFDDAESDPMPELFFTGDWKTIKSYFQREIPIIIKKLLDLQ
ncbi:MAG: hypothetical protein G01um101448_521 [Parcubacteria group bacterium Gr01-1014_48]|nr:MAG: hypothetical protein Greene041614_183 [Parcubacteria group bacterium Greene0416_14]TSC73832.1 MAG: hypothetical protein G01um101448_521 [Parcubacteria group bacterium Gr01-1014_48]TSD01213.1 MAG: hypothetical protein Greene101415_408 [Parcubacteria group bacterium Greene1014_15]TSD07311.1 MAG: hypothetical protein Greene07144_944 [Parcubacteria group bacterium Greene0714_4]